MKTFKKGLDSLAYPPLFHRTRKHLLPQSKEKPILLFDMFFFLYWLVCLLIYYDIELIYLYIFGRIGTDRGGREEEIRKRRDAGQGIQILRTGIRHNLVKFNNEEKSNSRIWHLSLK